MILGAGRINPYIASSRLGFQNNNENTSNQSGWSRERMNNNMRFFGETLRSRLGIRDREEALRFLNKIDLNAYNIIKDEQDERRFWDIFNQALGYYAWERIVVPKSGRADAAGWAGEWSDPRRIEAFMKEYGVGDEYVISNLTNIYRQALGDIYSDKAQKISSGDYEPWIDRNQIERIREYERTQKRYEDEIARIRNDMISSQQASVLSSIAKTAMGMKKYSQDKNVSVNTQINILSSLQNNINQMLNQFDVARKNVELSRIAGHRQTDIQVYSMTDEEYTKAKALALEALKVRFQQYNDVAKDIKDDAFKQAQIDMARERWLLEKQSAKEQKEMAEKSAIAGLFGTLGSVLGGVGGMLVGGPVGAMVGAGLGGSVLGGLAGIISGGGWPASLYGASYGLGTTSSLMSLYSTMDNILNRR